MLRLCFACLALSTGAAQAALISFEEYSAGDIVGDMVIDGVTVSVTGASNDGYGAMIYDSRTPSQADPDLGGPFTDVRGGDDIAPGNIVVLSEDGNSSNVDDASSGGFMEFVFDVPIVFESFIAFDMNKVGQISLELFDDNGSLGSVSNQFAGANNSYEFIEFFASNVTRAVFDFNKGGAIGEIAFQAPSFVSADTIRETPLPTAGLLFTVGAALVLRRKRRATPMG
ncbi:MAG: hypothetical protein AAF788_00785 [Pseudomonadota bacterium]